jgi:hypothetical protein
MIELSGKSPCLHPVFGPAFTPYALSKCYLPSKEIFIKSEYEMLKTQHLMHKGSRVTNYTMYIVVQVGAVKIYVTTVEGRGLRKKGKRGRNSVHHQN